MTTSAGDFLSHMSIKLETASSGDEADQTCYFFFFKYLSSFG
jgi:hypothetical protein